MALFKITGDLWKAWSMHRDVEYNDYPSSSKYSPEIDCRKKKITAITSTGIKSYVKGEYGTAHVQAYYDGSWNTLASAEPGSSASEITWYAPDKKGVKYIEAVRTIYSFQVCKKVHVYISVYGYEK